MLLYHLVTGAFPVRAATIDELRDGHATGAGVRLRDARPDLPTRVRARGRSRDRADPAAPLRERGALEELLNEALSGERVPHEVSRNPARADVGRGSSPQHSPSSSPWLAG